MTLNLRPSRLLISRVTSTPRDPSSCSLLANALAIVSLFGVALTEPLNPMINEQVPDKPKFYNDNFFEDSNYISSLYQKFYGIVPDTN